MTLVERFFKTRDFYLYGATPAAEAVMELLAVHGKQVIAFVDKSAAKQEIPFLGYSVIAPEDLSLNRHPESGVIVVSAYQLEIANALVEVGVPAENIFPLLDGMFLPTYQGDFLNSQILDDIAGQLKYDEEKDYFASWRLFKKTGNLLSLKPMPSIGKQYEHKQWLNSLRVGGAAVDVGAFDGETSIDLAETEIFSKVYAFEPFQKNYELLQNNIQAKDVDCLIEGRQIAIGASRQTFFQGTEDVTSRSRIVHDANMTGGEKVEVFPLDALRLDDVSLIKVDIEGFELEFLKGAIETLRRWQPHLAISAYHHRDHPEKIADFLYKNFDDVYISVGHHPLAVYELEFYVSFG